MARSRGRRAFGLTAVAAAASLLLSACWGGNDSDIVLRSDPQMYGMVASTQYTIDGAPDGSSETNVSITQGIGNYSPLVGKVTTAFGKGAGTSTETVTITGKDGVDHAILAMSRRSLNFGLSNAMTAYITTYDSHDHSGHRVCGAKVRIDMEPSIVGTYILGEGDGRSWEILMYYSVPCSQDGDDMPLGQSTFIGASINQMFQVRVSGDPMIFNRGHSVTVTGGPLAGLTGGWWEHNLSIVSVSKQIGELVHELSTSKTPWLGFNPGAKYASTDIVYSAGDADQYNLKRFALNRQSAYMVNVRRQPTDPWTSLLVKPSYLSPWNDLEQSWKAFTGDSLPKINDLVDDNGMPKLDKGIPDGNLKKIETAGCQNCSNPKLSMIQLMSGPNSVDYSMAIRAWYGANSSMVLFGRGLQGDPTKVLNSATGNSNVECPSTVDNDGTVHTMNKDRCNNWRKNAAFMQMISGDPNRVGADVVGTFRVDNNGTFKSVCHGSGDNTSCTLQPDENKLSASYQFSNNGAGLENAWSAMQLLGPVGMDTLGMSYASQPYNGSGLNFGMLQSIAGHWYQGDITKSPWMVFALDARALTIPGALDQSLTAIGR
jgi:hypothetical protein